MDTLRAALQQNVALICFDHQMFSVHELLGHVRRIVGTPSTPLLSIAFMSFPDVSLMRGEAAVSITARETLCVSSLERNTAMASFWKSLATFVDRSGHIAFLGCGVTKDESSAAQLIYLLQGLTRTRHAASDDASEGYPLRFLSDDGKGLQYADARAMESYFV